MHLLGLLGLAGQLLDLREAVGIRSFTTSRKFIWISRCARPMRNGVGLPARAAQYSVQTISSISTASVRIRRSPGPPRAPGSDAVLAVRAPRRVARLE